VLKFARPSPCCSIIAPSIAHLLGAAWALHPRLQLEREILFLILQAPALHSHNACRFGFVHICCGGCIQLSAAGIGAAYKVS
jgi:hypothetical protein